MLRNTRSRTDSLEAEIASGLERRDIYCFFDNTDVKLRAQFDAQSLMRKLFQSAGAHREPGHDRKRLPTET